MAGSGWTPQKVASFRKAFFDFLKCVRIDSKEFGGDYCLADGVYDAQHRLVDGVLNGLSQDKHDVKCLKSRQLGISTISEALFVFWIGMFTGIQAAVIFDTAGHLKEARLRIKNLIKRLPKSLHFPTIMEDSRDILTLSNASTIRWLAAGVRETESSGGLGRSSGLNVIWASEVSSWKNEEGIVSLKETLSETFENRLFLWESPLSLDTPIPIPSGWTTMGKISEGDEVFDDQGNACNVVGVSPVFINKKCYRIKFSNGDEIIADANHKWQIEERRYPTNQQWKTRVVRTDELNVEKHRIVIGKALSIPNAELPIDPYFLGMWLGDGRTDNPAICAGDADIDEFRQLLKDRGIVIGPISKSPNRIGKFTALGQRPVFSAMGLLGRKHIPGIYLRASEHQRRELLAGIMDTDGHISKTNYRSEYCSISPELVDGVAELLSSLGIKFSRSILSEEGKVRSFPGGNTNACARSERLRFSEDPKLKVFNLRRKAEVQESQRGPYGFGTRRAKWVMIDSIEQVPSVPVRCISVDSPTHLFLAGRTMIPTHNTARGYNAWHDMWIDAKNDDLGQTAIFIGWWAHPLHVILRGDSRFERYGRADPTKKEQEIIAKVARDYGHEITPEQLAWHRYKIDPNRDLEEGEKKSGQFKIQEQPSVEEEAFQQAGSSFFDHVSLTQHSIKLQKLNRSRNYRYTFGSEFHETQIMPATHFREIELRVWDPPAAGVEYIVAADPAFGRNPDNDRSAVQVLAAYADCVEQVAEYACPTVNTDQFAWVIASIAAYYKRVTTIIELDGPGEAVWKQYHELPRIIRAPYLSGPVQERGLTDVFNNVRDYIYRRSDSLGGSGAYNWKTGNRKEAIMEKLRALVTTGSIILKSMDTIQEMRSMARDGASIEAPSHKHDDRVLALAIAVRAWEDEIRPGLISRGRTFQAITDARQMTTEGRFQIFMNNTIQDMFKRSERQAKLDARAKRLMQSGLSHSRRW
jgi:hypothetical protein